MQVSPTYFNQLKNVSDAISSGNTMGFVDGNTNPALDDYEYDLNGNMVKDRNKGITSITYNHLNLPERIEWSANKFITYQYNAAGQKVTKTVRSNDSIKVVRYLDGFQYAGDILQFFPHSEGYVKATPTGNITPGSPPTGYAYNYVFNYTDHLGNIRLSYTKDPQQGTLKILEEIEERDSRTPIKRRSHKTNNSEQNHYYPFGLKHEVYVTGSKRDFIENSNDPGETILTNVLKTDYQYKYNGKEFQDELGLNFYDYGARNYDPAIGRWMNIDPAAEMSFNLTPYRYCGNNPILFNDLTGLWEFKYDKEEKKLSLNKSNENDNLDTFLSESGLSKGQVSRHLFGGGKAGKEAMNAFFSGDESSINVSKLSGDLGEMLQGIESALSDGNLILENSPRSNELTGENSVNNCWNCSINITTDKRVDSRRLSNKGNNSMLIEENFDKKLIDGYTNVNTPRTGDIIRYSKNGGAETTHGSVFLLKNDNGVQIFTKMVIQIYIHILL